MKRILLPLFCLCMAHAYSQQDCQHPQIVGPGTHSVSYTANSQVPAPICTNGQNNNPDKGAWFAYTPTETHTTTVNTVASMKDTRVHIYTGACAALLCVAGDDDSGGSPYYTSIATFTANAGQTYLIAFDNNWNSDNFSFTLTEAEFVQPMFTAQPFSIGGWMQNCVADMNGDYLDDIVSPDENFIRIHYQNANGSFTSATVPAQSTTFMPTWSIAAGDFDKNGYNDLVYGNDYGVCIMKANGNGTSYIAMDSPANKYIFSQRSNFVDINNDGNLDAFVCHDVEPNVYFLNNGTGGYTFYQSNTTPGAMNLGVYPLGGNYGSIWVDYDNDGDVDLFIAKCRGGGNPASIDELHRNNGDGTFTNVAAEAGFSDYHQSWSAAWGDFDNDGDMDVLVGASSDVAGSHKLMRNNGNGTFTNVTTGSGFDNFAPMEHEHVAYDFNNDGFIDVMGGGNTIMFNNGDMTFSPVAIPASPGPIGDLNNDGFLDIQNHNMIYINSDNGNNWLKLHLQGIESNRNGIGARVEIYTTGSPWAKQIRDVRSGDGFSKMNSLNVYFGLGAAESIDQVVVKWPSGTIDIIENPDINEALLVVEGSTLGISQQDSNTFALYPNPAKDVLNINANDQTIVKASLYDLGGKLIKSVSVDNGIIPVQQLAKGTYIIIMQDSNGKQHSSKFIKG